MSLIDTLEIRLGRDGEDFAMDGVHRSGILGAGGADVSPRLRWSAPDGVEVGSYAVTVYDPDAPTGSGFWHWSIFDIPADCTELPENAGAVGSAAKPAGAKEVRNDAGFRGYVGAAPPPGHGPHRYYFRVHALGVPKLELSAEVSPALVGFGIWEHEVARGEAMVTYEVPA